MLTLRTEIKLLLVILFWAFFGLGYFQRFPMTHFGTQLYLIVLALVVTASACGYGAWLVSRAPPDLLTPAEFVLFSIIAGFGMVSLVMMGAGVVSLWTHGGAIVIVAIGLFGGWFGIRRRRPESWVVTGPDLATTPLFLILVGFVLSLAMAFTPVTYYDSLVYHFTLPDAYVRAGHWIGQVPLIYSAFPQAMEMLWTLGMLLVGDVLANLLAWIIAVAGVCAVYAYAKRYFGKSTAGWAAAFLAVMPAYLYLSSGGYVDVGLAVFAFMSFYALSLWRDNPAPGLLVLAGFLAGITVGIKYTGAIPLAIGALIIVKDSHPWTIKNISKQKLLYILPAFIVFMPWLAKNYIYVGNPIFPFGYSWITTRLNPWVGGAAAGYFNGLTEYAPRSGFRLIGLLWDAAVHGLNFGGGMDVLGDLGWAPLFGLLPLIWLAKKKPAAIWLLLLYSLLFFIPWGMSRPVLRFLMPLAPFLAIAAAYGYDQGTKGQPKGFRIAAHLFLGLMLLSNVRLFFEAADVLSPFAVPLGLQSRAQYLSQKLNYFDAAAFVNDLPENSLTYVIGDQRGYYYRRPVLVTPVFNTNPLTEWANDAASPQALAKHLRDQHITHLLVNHTEFDRLDHVYHLFPFTEKGKANWNQLTMHVARPVYRDRNCEVLALGEAP